MSELQQRCAAFGWTLRPDGEGWELLGNGAPASFHSTASLVDWLQHQERSRQPAIKHDTEPHVMHLEAASWQ